MLNFALTVAEQCVRQVYFRSNSLRAWRARRMPPREPRTLIASQLLARIAHLGVRAGDSLMVHSALAKLRIVDDVFAHDVVVEGGKPVADLMLGLLRSAIGDEGTLLMPTFPKYANDPEYFSPENDGSQIWRYDPVTSPSKSGLLTEIFRNQAACVRSHFPSQTVAALLIAIVKLLADVAQFLANGGDLLSVPFDFRESSVERLRSLRLFLFAACNLQLALQQIGAVCFA